jgi:hypothetical protein
MLAGEETRHAGEELVDLVWVLYHDAAVGNYKADINDAAIVERCDQAAELALEPCCVEICDHAVQGKKFDRGRVVNEAATPFIQTAIPNLRNNVRLQASTICQLSISYAPDVI